MNKIGYVALAYDASGKYRGTVKEQMSNTLPAIDKIKIATVKFPDEPYPDAHAKAECLIISTGKTHDITVGAICETKKTG